MLEISSETGASRVPLRSTPVRVGRIADNDVVIANEPTVSRHHIEFHHDDSGWRVVDLGGLNGTHVNGQRLAAGSSAPLGPGDVVGIGSVTMKLSAVVVVDSTTVHDPGGGDVHRLLTALSAREIEVLTLVAAGRTDADVAAELFISVKTVHSHLDRIRDKTGVRRRAELTRLAVRLGLSTPAP